MDPLTALAIADGLVTLLEKLAGPIQEAVKKGQISPETQAALDARIQALRQGGAGFAGPEWKV
jgi:hypothetical protein